MIRYYHHKPYPDSADFNNANITLVFEPDEDAEVNEKSAPIFVTDDAINEATEQVFVAELILASSLDPAPVDLTRRPSTLCRIIDNDRKFESVYTAIIMNALECRTLTATCMHDSCVCTA